MKKYIKLCRVSHYIKNGLIFLPLIFVKKLFSDSFINVLYGFIAFSFISSVVYIINDFKDIEKDKHHPTKCNRPLASGQIKPMVAILIAISLFLLALLFNYLAAKSNIYNILLLLIYLVINVLYSFGLKNVPLIDILILVTGYIIRIYYGAQIIGVNVSDWLYLTVMSAAFFMGLGKRRNEMLKGDGDTRKVLSAYTKEFLDKNMYVFLALTIVFYSLWVIDQDIQYLILTIPLIIMIFMKYTLIIEGNSYGDPTEVLLKDRWLQLLLLLFGAIMLYFMK